MLRPLVIATAALLAGCAIGAENPHTQIPLLNGRDLSTWQYVTSPAKDIGSVCHYNPDGSLAIAGKPIGYIATRKSYDNYRLHAEWRWPTQSLKTNSGVLVHIASGPKDRQWPVCFQVQLKPTRAGDLLPMAGAEFKEKLSTPPEAKTPQLNRRADSSEKPLGEWNRCDIVCRDGIIEVTINGVLQNKVTEASPAAGAVGFQFEGYPYELRNVWITPLD